MIFKHKSIVTCSHYRNYLNMFRTKYSFQLYREILAFKTFIDSSFMIIFSSHLKASKFSNNIRVQKVGSSLNDFHFIITKITL
jgi:hypothetical protein